MSSTAVAPAPSVLATEALAFDGLKTNILTQILTSAARERTRWMPAFPLAALSAALLLVLGCATLNAHSAGPDPRYSGAPGDNPGSCTSCHRGTAINAGGGSVKIVLPNGNSYVPGVRQHIQVQIADTQQRRWGFQFSARLKSDQINGQAGDFSSTDGFTQVICGDASPAPCPASASVQFIEHTSAGTRFGSSAGVTFEFDWTPRAADSGSVVLYVAANAANGDGNLTGDHIYTTSLEISQNNPPPAPLPVTKYQQHNLVSDIQGLADQTDVNLLNPWGLALNPTGAFWIADNRAGAGTLYNGAGQPFPLDTPLVLSIPAPPAGNAGGAPTGVVFNGTPAFEITPGNPAMFLFTTDAGTIAAWNPVVNAGGTQFVVDQSASGAAYKGVAIGNSGSGPLLFAANFSAGRIDIFDAKFQPVKVAGGFSDPNLPPGFAPFNIRLIGRKLYVTYALQDSTGRNDAPGAGNGLIDVFDVNGMLLQRLVQGGVLNSPWGITLAPGFFGDYSDTLLVGNFGDGTINGFDAFSGEFLGTLQDSAGNPLTIQGLRALQFGNSHVGGDANTLYFTAGISGGGNPGDHGLLGSLQVVQ